MIRKISINDEDSYLKLGLLLNNNFCKLFDLTNLMMYDYNKIYVYIINDKVIGFVHGTLSFDSMDIINIAIDSSYRNRGYAKELIDFLKNEFCLKDVNVEVKVSNPALVFYNRLGFIKYRDLPKYYGDEDGVFLKKVFK